jgi:hypothetical protein
MAKLAPSSLILLCNTAVHQLDDNGTMAIVLPHGFVSWWCRRTRQYLIKRKITSMP